MSPAMRLGNWVRRVCPSIRKHTQSFTETVQQGNILVEDNLTTLDRIVHITLTKHQVSDVRYTAEGLYVTVGNLKFFKYNNSKYIKIKYKDECLGNYFNLEMISILNQMVWDYFKNVAEDAEERIRMREQDKNSRLLQILEEVK